MRQIVQVSFGLAHRVAQARHHQPGQRERAQRHRQGKAGVSGQALLPGRQGGVDHHGPGGGAIGHRRLVDFDKVQARALVTPAF